METLLLGLTYIFSVRHNILQFLADCNLYLAGVSSVISGLLTFWNVGFAFGFWEFCFTTLFISIAYFCMVLCLAEMISILPFAG